MTSRTTPQFWAHFARLPIDVQRLARRKYPLWARDPDHPSFHFKPVGGDFWSLRISLDYRGVRRGDLIVWTWIGPHDEYDRLLASARH